MYSKYFGVCYMVERCHKNGNDLLQESGELGGDYSTLIFRFLLFFDVVHIDLLLKIQIYVFKNVNLSILMPI